MFKAKLKFMGIKGRNHKGISYALLETIPITGPPSTFYMATYHFNKYVPVMVNGVIEGEWLLGMGKTYNIVRPYTPTKNRKGPDPMVYFSKTGFQQLRKSSYRRWDGPAAFSIPKKPFEAVLKFDDIFKRTYSVYASFKLSRLDADLMFGIDKELEFSMKRINFNELVLKGFPLDSINAVWNFESGGGGTTTLICEKLL